MVQREGELPAPSSPAQPSCKAQQRTDPAEHKPTSSPLPPNILHPDEPHHHLNSHTRCWQAAAEVGVYKKPPGTPASEEQVKATCNLCGVRTVQQLCTHLRELSRLLEPCCTWQKREMLVSGTPKPALHRWTAGSSPAAGCSQLGGGTTITLFRTALSLSHTAITRLRQH